MVKIIIKGINKCYEVEISKMKFEGKEAVSITLADVSGHMMSVVISKWDFDRVARSVVNR